MLVKFLRQQARKLLIIVRTLAQDHWVEAIALAVLVGLAVELVKFVDARRVESENQSRMNHALAAVAVVGTEKSDLGSGVFINNGGIFITNNTILEGRNFAAIWVELPGGKRFSAPSRICANGRYDIAVLRFSGQGIQELPVARPGRLDRLQGREPVVIAFARLGSSPGTAPGTIMHEPWWSPEKDSGSAIKLIQFVMSKPIPGVLLGANGDLLGIVATPDDIAKSVSQTTNLAVPINVFRAFFEGGDAPKGLTGTAQASDTTAPQRKLCQGLNPDYLQSFEQEMTDEALAIAADKNQQYADAVDHYKDAIKRLRYIASARGAASPEPNLQADAQRIEAAAAAEAERRDFAAAAKHYREALEDWKLIAFPSGAAPSDRTAVPSSAAPADSKATTK